MKILNWKTKEVLFECEEKTLKKSVKFAVQRDADLRGANLRDADLWGADLRDADLRGADLGGAILCDANLHKAKISCRSKTIEINFKEVK